MTPIALKTLKSVMLNPKSPPAARVAAASAILDRGYGKPTQQMEAKVDCLDQLSDAEQRALVAALEAIRRSRGRAPARGGNRGQDRQTSGAAPREGSGRAESKGEAWKEIMDWAHTPAVSSAHANRGFYDTELSFSIAASVLDAGIVVKIGDHENDMKAERTFRSEELDLSRAG
jgi:hypothetical protein